MEEGHLLAGVRVLELGDGVAGAVAGAVLASLGATVHTVVSERRRIADLGSTLAGTLDLDKVLIGDPAEAGEVDITIVDAIDQPRTGAGAEYEARSAGSPVGVVLTPFGLTGPRAGDLGGELVAQAAGGLLATVSGPDDRPVSPAPYLALRATGHVAALASLHGLDLTRRGGDTVLVDVSAQEAVVFAAALPECAHAIFRCPGRAGSGRYVAPSGLFPCRDGLVRIAAIENHQWQGMVRCLGAPAWTEGLEEREARAERAPEINERVAAWSAEQEKEECARRLQAEGVPSTPVNGPEELLASPQLRARGRLVSRDVAGARAEVPLPSWVLSLDGESEHARSGDLRDLRILELTHVLAGPIVGALLGAMGADVVRFEDLDRLDIYRRTGPFAEGVRGVERGAYFAVANHSKTSVAVGSDDAVDVVKQLVSQRDVVIENVGTNRLRRLGALPEATAPAGVLTARVSGFGSTGPMADYKVYANNVQAYGGLAHLTRDRDGAPAHLGTVLADPLSSVVAATVVAAWWLGPERRRGGVVDLSMAEVVMSTIAEHVVAASTGHALPVNGGVDRPPFAPHGAYRAADGWVVVAVQSDEEWRALVATMGSLAAGEDATESERWARRGEIDAALEAALASSSAVDVAARLQRAGVRAAVVRSGAELLDDEHLSARDFFPAFAHADPSLEGARLVGLPWRFAGSGAVPLAPPPALGCANAAWGLDEVGST